MINIPTVFILGAGSNVDYGFPSGAELRKRICSKDFLSKYRNMLVSAGGISELQLISFVNRMADFQKDFHDSSTASIDLFLSRRPEFSQLGKIAIITEILDAEMDSKFREEIKEISNLSQDWYSFIYHRMTESITRSNDYGLILNNEVSFITFNYDRSLEHFFYDSITNSFNINEAEISVATVINSMNFIHVYGQIGKLPWQTEIVTNNISYGAKPNIQILREHINDIHTIHDERQNIETKNIRALLKNAKRIFFLGFGFAPENLNVLGIPYSLNGNQEIYGTAFRLKKGEIQKAISQFEKWDNNNRIGADLYKIKFEDYTCLDLLREYL